MYNFSKTSIERLNSCHIDLQLIANKSISVSPIDFGISCGYRSIEDQKKAHKEGYSKLDGIKNKSKHNYYPSLAFDIFISDKNKMYDVSSLCLVAGVIIAVSNALYQKKQISHRIRWGGNWDGDTEIITDQNFDDLPHFELI